MIAVDYGERARLWLDLAGAVLFLLPMAIIIGWLSWPLFVSSWHVGEVSPNAGGLLRWPVKIVMPLGFLLLTFQGLSELIKRIALLHGDRMEAEVVTEYHRPEQ